MNMEQVRTRKPNRPPRRTTTRSTRPSRQHRRHARSVRTILALTERNRSGKGQLVELPLIEGALQAAPNKSLNTAPTATHSHAKETLQPTQHPKDSTKHTATIPRWQSASKTNTNGKPSHTYSTLTPTLTATAKPSTKYSSHGQQQETLRKQLNSCGQRESRHQHACTSTTVAKPHNTSTDNSFNHIPTPSLGTPHTCPTLSM